MLSRVLMRIAYRFQNLEILKNPLFSPSKNRSKITRSFLSRVLKPPTARMLPAHPGRVRVIL